MAKKSSKSSSAELHPMLLKGMILGLVLGLAWMFYVNVLRSQYEATQDAVQGVYNNAQW